jgi:predicted GH43/DUF377 family glycosyl hydrolase
VATFNPAAISLGGTVHLLYRAIGSYGMSVLGYASSRNGLTIDQRPDDPAYLPREAFEMTPPPGHRPGALDVAARGFTSGGGYGGTEDPRLTVIGDTVHMTYVAFDGLGPPRIALTSISVRDFLARRWHWRRPTLISRPGIVDKNGCLFPETIGGRYVFLHRVFPDILIDVRDSLEFAPGEYLAGRFAITPRSSGWDSRKVGAGPPPIRTDEGWLLLYHAVDDRDDSRYRIGAMLLDLEDPTRVRYRSRRPILEPDLWYEIEGRTPGVVYPCGAVVHGRDLIVYYGSADRTVCAARAELGPFLEALAGSST